MKAQVLVAALLEADDDFDIEQYVQDAPWVPKKITLHGRRWFRRGAGGTYCTCNIFIDDKFVHQTAEQGGYGDYYVQAAFEWLIHKGIINREHNEPPWVTAKRMGFELEYSATDVKRERDLFL